jgi:hypothetical protein
VDKNASSVDINQGNVDMPQPKKYPSEAEKKAAYRARRRAKELALMQQIADAVLHHPPVLHQPEKPVLQVERRRDPEPAPERRPGGLISWDEHEDQVRGRELSYTLSGYSRSA